MRRYRRLLAALLLVTACWAVPAHATVKPSDAVATHDYLVARIALGRAETRLAPASLKALSSLAEGIERECPGVLADEPPSAKGEDRSSSASEISQEISDALFGAEEHIDHMAEAHYASTVRRLRWSSRKLTRLLRSLAIEAAEQSGVEPPDLCADTRAWASSGYTTVSDATKLYLQRLQTISSITLIESEPGEPASNFLDSEALVAYRLKRYEDKADARLARKVFPPPRPEDLSNALKPLVEANERVYAALEQPPAATA